MAYAVLATNKEHYWGFSDHSFYNNKKITNPNPNPKNPNVQFHQIQNPNYPIRTMPTWQNKEGLVVTCSRRPESEYIVRDDYVTINLSEYSKTELRELERRLRGELDHVRQVRARIEKMCSVENPPLVQSTKVPKKLSGRKRGRVSKPRRETKRVSSLSGFNSPEMDGILKKVMTRCSTILGKLMKYKHAWVFNIPVDPAGLGLHDYFDFIKCPMDLGTVKTKMSKKEYKNPNDFASDVRLTFKNAMVYNTKGQDVHEMADNLLGVFEKMFNPVFHKFEAERVRLVSALGINKRVSEKMYEPKSVVDNVPKPAPIQKMLHNVAEKKVKESDKRVMSFDEKENLGICLQELAMEDMGEMLAILSKKNTGMAQEGDEIELDFDALDNETLWELQRFVNNLVKVKALAVATPVEKSVVRELTPTKVDIMEEDVDIGEDIPINNYPPLEIEKDNSSSSSSDSSSSSGSGSVTSSGSDSDEDSVQSPFVEPK